MTFVAITSLKIKEKTMLKITHACSSSTQAAPEKTFLFRYPWIYAFGTHGVILPK